MMQKLYATGFQIVFFSLFSLSIFSSNLILRLKPAYLGKPVFGACIAPYLKTLIEHEHKQIIVAAYALTSEPISTALKQARKEQNLKIQCLVDSFSLVANGSRIKELVDDGCEVFQYAPETQGIMHHKLWLFFDNDMVDLDRDTTFSDRRLFVTGSANVTAAAVDGKNKEHVICGYNAEIFSSYLKELRKIKNNNCVVLKNVRTK